MRNKRILILPVFIICLVLSSCSLRLNWVPGREILLSSDNLELSAAEVRLLSAAYKAEFESYYSGLLGKEFWSTPLDSGISYEDYIKEYFVYKECRALLVLNEKALSDGISLSDLDKERIDEASLKIYDALSDDEKEYTKASVKDLQRLIRLYYTAMEEVRLLSDGDVSVSDEESRVADFSVIRLNTREEAEDALERLSQGESFRILASECTLDSQIDYSVSKGELMPELNDVIFSMQSGETSDIIEFGGSYYIFRVTNAYNSLLSMNNKRNILAERAYKLWSAAYRQLEGSVKIYRNDHLWNEIRLNTEGDFPDPGLFAVLSEICD